MDNHTNGVNKGSSMLDAKYFIRNGPHSDEMETDIKSTEIVNTRPDNENLLRSKISIYRATDY